jgi:hypothetical protein
MDSFFDIDVDEEARDALRAATGTGRPLGASAWIKSLEASTGRSMTAAPVGRPPRSAQEIRDTHQFSRKLVCVPDF